jgi:hypothetical protein
MPSLLSSGHIDLKPDQQYARARAASAIAGTCHRVGVIADDL